MGCPDEGLIVLLVKKPSKDGLFHGILVPSQVSRHGNALDEGNMKIAISRG